MFEVNDKLRSLYVKETGAPIALFKKGYFEERLMTYGLDFDFQEFIAHIRNVNNQEETANEIIERLNNNKMELAKRMKKQESFLKFNKLDMTQFDSRYSIPKGDIYNQDNVGKRFISIDLKEANFVALAYTRKFGLEMLNGAKNYFDFCMGLDFDLDTCWKGSRQFLFGNLNPKRQVKIQKFIMEKLVDRLVANLDGFTVNNICKINNDELVISDCGFTKQEFEYVAKRFSKELMDDAKLQNFSETGVFKVEEFTLKNVPKLGCYVKVDDLGTWKRNWLDSVKCLNKMYIPLFMKALKDEPVLPNDLIFYHDHNLSMMLEYPKVTHEELMDNLK